MTSCATDSHKCVWQRESGPVRRIPMRMVACVFIVICSAPVGAADDQWAREQIAKALQSRSATWAPGAVEEISERVVGIQRELGREYTREEVLSIAKGLGDDEYLQEAADWMHPLLQERNRARIVCAVRDYAIYGPVDPVARGSGRAQVVSVLRECVAEVATRLPECADDVLKASEWIEGYISRTSDNPLRRLYMLEVPDGAIRDNQERWRESLAAFRLESDATPEERDEALKGLLMRCIGPLLIHEPRKAQVPHELALAEEELSAHSAEVLEYAMNARSQTASKLSSPPHMRQESEGTRDNRPGDFYADLIPSLANVPDNGETPACTDVLALEQGGGDVIDTVGHGTPITCPRGTKGHICSAIGAFTCAAALAVLMYGWRKGSRTKGGDATRGADKR